MHLAAIPYLHGIDFVVCDTLVSELIWPARRSVVQGKNPKFRSADLTFTWPSSARRGLGTFGYWENAVKHFNNASSLFAYFFSILIFTRFYILYCYVPIVVKCFTTCCSKLLIWSTKLWGALDQLNLIKALHKFSFIIILTGTFRCVCEWMYGLVWRL